MYALISIGGIVNLVLAGITLGGVIRPDLSDSSPMLIAFLIVINLSAGLYSARSLSGGTLRRTKGDLFFRHIPPTIPDLDEE